MCVGEKVLLVAYAFALREHEPNPCNVRLADETEQIARRLEQQGFEIVLVVQWEVALGYKDLGYERYIDHIVRQRPNGEYLGSKEVWDEAIRVTSRQVGISKAVAVANPFLHLFMVRRMMKASGFDVLNRRVGWIGFDPSRLNMQWWCRGPIRLIVYSALTLVGYHGHAGRQSV